MSRKPMTYVFMFCCPPNEPASYIVFLYNKIGEKASLKFDSPIVAKAFTEALNGLGFTKKRRF